jgi:hypothetical protein
LRRVRIDPWTAFLARVCIGWGVAVHPTRDAGGEGWGNSGQSPELRAHAEAGVMQAFAWARSAHPTGSGFISPRPPRPSRPLPAP